MMLISLTRRYCVSKLVYHQIFIFSALELSFKRMVHAGLKRHLWLISLYMRHFSDDYLLNPCFFVGHTLSDLKNIITRSNGWRSAESARLPPMRPGFKSRRRRHMWVEFVVAWFSPWLREVFLRALRFSPLLKNQHFQIPIRPGIR